MAPNCIRPDRQRSGERGSIIIMTAIFMLLLFLMVGLCIDVSRIYMVRAELQNAADAAALTGARELNAGTTGIDNAITQATIVTNTVDFAKLGIGIAQVTFAKFPGGPYLDAITAKDKANVADILYVRVETKPVNTAILFGIAALGTSHTETRSAVAGMSVGINGFCDYFPIAIAKTNPTVPYADKELVPVKFKDNTGTTINLPDKTFVVLDTPWVTGNGADETRDAMAGVAPRCTHVGDILNFSKSPSANAMNGPKQTEDGTNTRFLIYPPGNQLTYNNAKPASNIWGSTPLTDATMTFDQYKDNDPATRRPPPSDKPGSFDRRLLLIPIIEPIPNSDNPTGSPSGKVKDMGYFFLRQAVDGNCPRKDKGKDVPCPPGTTASGDILLEYVNKDALVGRGIFDPTICSSTLGVAVLYR